MKRFCVITIVLLFLAGCSVPDAAHKVVTPGLSAAIEASNTYNPLSIPDNIEYGGVIFKEDNGNYSYTVYKGSEGSGNVSFSLAIPEKTTRVAFWHTHGGRGALKKYYSSMDSGLVREYGVPFYMSDYTGKLWILPVKHRKTSRTQGVYIGDLK